MFKPYILSIALLALSVTGCHKTAGPTAEPRPVRTVAVEQPAAGETISLTGQVRAKDQVNLAFRLDGRVIERLVNVGDVVTTGQVVARLDPQNQQNALRSAQDNLASAGAALTQARLTFQRQQELLKNLRDKGITKYDPDNFKGKSAIVVPGSSHRESKAHQKRKKIQRPPFEIPRWNL